MTRTSKDLGGLAQQQVFCYGVGTVLYDHHKSPQKQCALETGISSSSAQCILQCVKCKFYIPWLLHTINDDDPDQRCSFLGCFKHTVHEDGEFVSRTVWSDEAIFKLNGTMNRDNFVSLAPENLDINVDKAVNLPGLSGVDCHTEV
jgi:hypothetical protein